MTRRLDDAPMAATEALEIFRQISAPHIRPAKKCQAIRIILTLPARKVTKAEALAALAWTYGIEAKEGLHDSKAVSETAPGA